MSSGVKDRPLVAFDFDHTLMDVNTDHEVQKLSPGGKLPEGFEDKYYKSDGFTEFMQQVFIYLHQNQVAEQTIKDFIRHLPFSEGCANVLQSLKTELKAEIIIISDANTLFIEELLDEASLTSYVDKVFSNPARFDESGCLTLTPFDEQDHCQLSNRNICKGQVLDNYIDQRRSEGQEFTFVSYVGDGLNDFCPLLRLNRDDLAFPRKGFRLEKHIQAQAEKQLIVKAKVLPWEKLTSVHEAIASHHSLQSSH